MKLFYTSKLTKESVCELEQDLIDEYKDKVGYQCLNKNDSSRSCISNDHGIVYFRIYKAAEQK